MKHHTSNRAIALVLLVLLALLLAGRSLVYGGSIDSTVPGHTASRGVRFEVALRSGDWVGTAVVALERSPVDMLSPAALLTNGCSRSTGLTERLHGAAVLVRALGRAAWAVLKESLGAPSPGATGEHEDEDSNVDRRRSA